MHKTLNKLDTKFPIEEVSNKVTRDWSFNMASIVPMHSFLATYVIINDNSSYWFKMSLL